MFMSRDRKRLRQKADGATGTLCGGAHAQIGSWNSTDGLLTIYDDSTNETRQLSSTQNVTYVVTTIKASTSPPSAIKYCK